MDSIRFDVAVNDGCMKMDVMKLVYIFQIIIFAPSEFSSLLGRHIFSLVTFQTIIFSNSCRRLRCLIFYRIRKTLSGRLPKNELNRYVGWLQTLKFSLTVPTIATALTATQFLKFFKIQKVQYEYL